MEKKMLRINLSDKELRELKQLRQQTGDERSERVLMIILSHEGLKVNEIAKQLKRHPHTVRYWIKRYISLNLAGLRRKYSPGAPSTKRSNLMKLLEEWLIKSPVTYGYQSSTWTIPIIIDNYKKLTSETVSEDTVQRALKNLGYSYKKPKKTTPTNSPSKSEKKQRVKDMLQEIEEFIDDDEVDIYFLDETHFSTQPYLVKGWFKKRCTLFDPNTNQKRGMHNFWCLEYKGRKAYLEEFKKKQ